MNELIYWVWLSTVSGAARVTPNTLLKYFGSPEAVYQAGEPELKSAPVDWAGCMSLYLNKSLKFADRILEYCDKNKVGIVSLKDMFYPERLRLLPNRPILMYYLGNFIDIDNTPCLAIVGTRKVTERGIRITKRIAYDSARAGAVIISGLALGVDALAHKAALYAGKKTIGILGCGIDTPYPPQNRELIAEVCEKGLVMTEFAPGTPPSGMNFPIRNRVISALSSAVLITEAAQKSGALITAEYALKQHKPLFAVPRDILDTAGAGCNIILKAGAKPATCAEDILETLRTDYADKLDPPKNIKTDGADGAGFGGMRRRSAGRSAIIPPKFTAPASSEDESEAAAEESIPQERVEKQKPDPRPSLLALDDEERAFVLALSYDPVPIDTLVTDIRTVKKVLSLATSLEIKGFVTRYPGNRIGLKAE